MGKMPKTSGMGTVVSHKCPLKGQGWIPGTRTGANIGRHRYEVEAREPQPSQQGAEACRDLQDTQDERVGK